MNYYRLHIGDYLRDTAHLSLLEHGAYARLLQVYYTREAPIADADKYRLIGARTPEERAAVDVVLAEFFVPADGAWVQSRCDREIAAAKEVGEDNAARKDNERERQRRHRERRKELFAALREHGEVPPFDTSTERLSAMLALRTGNPPVTRDGRDGPRLSISQEPIAKKNQERESAPDGSPLSAGRGLRIPDDFPDAEAIDWCRTERPDLDPAQLAAKFRDYWLGVPGQRGRKANWPATWRNFVRSERVRAPPNGPPASKGAAFLAALGRVTTPDAGVVDVAATAASPARLGR